ncbi:hypothetical protein HDV01_003413 [Terramyces sp. JEL0728]|nr:hypothetical protein HDV01_003413 [Terramyces sp. JEL0728]
MQKNPIKTYSNKLFRNKELELERLRKWEIITNMGNSDDSKQDKVTSDPAEHDIYGDRTINEPRTASISEDYLLVEKGSPLNDNLDTTIPIKPDITQTMSFVDVQEPDTDEIIDRVQSLEIVDQAQSLEIVNDDTSSVASIDKERDLEYVTVVNQQAPALSEKSIQDLLDLCKQDRLFTFDEFFKNQFPTRKIGEATYSDVYLIPGKYTPQIAVKIIPIGSEDQLTVSSAWLEIKVSELISNLFQRDAQPHAIHYAKLERVGLVKGLYHEKLIDIWNVYNEQQDSENLPPDEYSADQVYLIMHMEYGGKDLEHSEIITNDKRVHSAFLQIVLSLAQAEQQLSFEHRDLHWGNVLVSSWKQSFLTFKLPIDGNTCSIVVPTASVKVTLIDFALSKLIYDDCLYYNDLELDPDLFTGKGVEKKDKLLNDLQGGVKPETELKPQVNLLQEIEEMAVQFQGMKRPSSPALSKLGSRNALKASPDVLAKFRTHSNTSTDSKDGKEFRTCALCSEPITSGGQVLGNKYYHSDHYNCNKCKKQLRGLLTFDRDKLLWCEKDYHQTFSAQCGYCKEPVKDEGIEALGMTFHEDHFFCAMCGKNLIKTSFIEYQAKAFCEDDYNTFFATRCAGCMQPLIDDYVTVLSKNYHKHCLVCTVCQKVISGTSLYTHDEQHYCEYHYYELTSNICFDCKGIIIGRCVVALDKKFHLNHFKCAFCSKILDEKGGYKEKSNKAYCTGCYMKIFN